MRPLLLVVCSLLAFASAICPSGYIGYTEKYCVRHMGNLSWVDAYKQCKTDGGRLPSTNDEVQVALASQVDPFWTPANCIFEKNSTDNGCYFTTSDPNNSLGCVYYGADNKLHNTNCFQQTFNSICIVDHNVPAVPESYSDTCFDGYNYFNRICWKFYPLANSNYSTADQACKNKGAHLASIEFEQENLFVTDLVKQALPGQSFSAWIGYIRGEGEELYWTNFRNKFYQNFQTSLPLQNCTVLQDSAKWGSVACGTNTNVKGYICARKSSQIYM